MDDSERGRVLGSLLLHDFKTMDNGWKKIAAAFNRAAEKAEKPEEAGRPITMHFGGD